MADITITQGTVSHALSATTPDDPAAEIQPQHWNSGHAASMVLAASVASALFSNVNGVSFGLSGSAITASHNALTTAMASNRGSDFVQATAAFAGTSASGTIASNGISVSIGPYITTGMLSNAATISNIRLSAGTTSNLASAFTFADSNGISFGLNAGTITGTVATNYQSQGAYLTTAALSNHSHGNPTLALTNLTGTTASASNGFTLSLSAAAAGAAVINFSAGTTSGNIGSVVFSNSNGVSFGLNGSTITGSHNGLTTAAASDHSHGNPTLALTNLTGTTASASNGFTLSLSAAAPGGGAGITDTFWYPYNEALNVVGAVGAGSLIFNPMQANVRKEFDRIGMVFTFTNASNSTGSMSLSLYVGFFTKNGSTLSLAHSQSMNQTIQYAGNNSSASNRGVRIVTMPWTTTITEGQYYVGLMSRTATAGANASISQMLVSALASGLSGMMGTATNRSRQWPLGLGLMSASTAAMPDSVAFSNLDGTGTSVARVPTWFALSGTA